MSEDNWRSREVKLLKVYAVLVVIWLLALALGCIGLIQAMFAQGLVVAPTSAKLLAFCIISGTLGSCVSALVSAAERIANGWQFSTGDKYPLNGPKDRFVKRMIPLFAIRPFLGSAVGLLTYAGIAGGYLIAVKSPDQQDFSQEALVFLSILAGLFAKTFIEKVKDMFDVLFGKKRTEDAKDG